MSSSKHMKDDIKEIIRALRKEETKSEKVFWQLVRNRRMYGKKFLRQFPIQYIDLGKDRFFIADFYCHEKKLVIEIDGKIHEKQRDYDELRTKIINQLGIKVVRFNNEDIENAEYVKSILKNYLAKFPSFMKRGAGGE